MPLPFRVLDEKGIHHTAIATTIQVFNLRQLIGAKFVRTLIRVRTSLWNIKAERNRTARRLVRVCVGRFRRTVGIAKPAPRTAPVLITPRRVKLDISVSPVKPPMNIIVWAGLLFTL